MLLAIVLLLLLIIGQVPTYNETMYAETINYFNLFNIVNNCNYNLDYSG